MKIAFRWTPLWVFLITAAVHVPVLDNGFVNWDDGPAFLENPHFRSLEPGELLWNFTHFHMGTYCPLTWTAFAAIHTLQGGLNPRGYHLASLLTHSAFAALLAVVIAWLLRLSGGEWGAGGPPSARLAGAAGALLFSLHPMQAASVAMSSALNDLAACAFTLGAVAAYLRRFLPGGDRLSWLCLSWSLAAAGGLCRWQGVGLPVTLLILDLFPLRRLPAAPLRWFEGKYWPVLFEKVPFAAVSFGIALFNSWAKVSQSGYGVGGTHPLEAAGGMVFLLLKFLLPTDLEPEYRLPAGAPGPHGWSGLESLAAVSAVTAILWVIRRPRPAALAAWAQYLLVLAPPFLLSKKDTLMVYDRYAYLAYPGFCALAAWGLFRAWRGRAGPRLKAMTGVLAISLLVLLSGVTRAELRSWHDSVSLWRHHLESNPRAFIARNNLGSTLFEQGRHDEALYFFLQESRIHPGEAIVRRNLKHTRERFGKLAPDLATVHNNQGVDLLTTGLLRESLWHLGTAAFLAPRMPEAHLNLGLIFRAQGSPARSRRHLRRALELDPGLDSARRLLSEPSAPAPTGGGRRK